MQITTYLKSKGRSRISSCNRYLVVNRPLNSDCQCIAFHNVSACPALTSKLEDDDIFFYLLAD